MSIYTEINDVAKSLDYHMQRQNIIAGNIANVDTPGYAPVEIQRNDTMQDSQFQLALQRTSAKHMHTDADSPTDRYKTQEIREHVPGNDLNYVSLDKEMARLSANTIRYETVSKLVTKQLGILKYAARDR